MKEIYIDGKKYYQQEQSDIDRLPKMNTDKNILLKYDWNSTLEKIKNK